MRKTNFDCKHQYLNYIFLFPKKNIVQGLKTTPEVQDLKTTKNRKLFKQEIMLKNRKLIGNNVGGPSGIAGWPPISTQTSPPPLGSNGHHGVECHHEMGKLLQKLVPSEPLSLVQQLVGLEKLIELDTLLVSILNMCVHGLIYCGLFNPISVELYWCQLLDNV